MQPVSLMISSDDFYFHVLVSTKILVKYIGLNTNIISHV